MGTRAYALDRCDALGISKWIPPSRIRSREDTVVSQSTGHKMKTLDALACKSCSAKAFVVDDSPSVWNMPVFVTGHSGTHHLKPVCYTHLRAHETEADL
eukprot:449248-Rhodomonas_salina.1